MKETGTKTIEIVYRKPSGKLVVHYRVLEGTEAAADMVGQLNALRRRSGNDCPYSWRYHSNT